MKTVFLCGPFTTIIQDARLEKYKERLTNAGVFDEEARSDYVKTFSRRRNIHAVKKAAQFLRNAGYNVFCPHFAISGYCTDLDDNISEHRKIIMALCGQWVEKCDCFATVPGWQMSDGCRMEYAIADVNKKEIIHLTYGQMGV